ncbi:MAG: hypothetical protein ACRETU_07965 [Steroidobacterales bacterium]
MNRALMQSLVFTAAVALAGIAGADDGGPAANGVAVRQSPGAQGPSAAAPTVSGTELPAMGAEEPKRLPPTTVNGYRDERLPVPCDRRQGTGKEACQAQLAAKYAEMDRLCRIVSSGSDLPVCIKNAYSAD